MKKLVLFFAAILSAGALYAQTDCSDIFMSEYVEGWNNNKSVELYNPTHAPIVLDNLYRIIRWSNGSTLSDQDIQYVVNLTGTIDSYKVMVIIQDTIPAGQDTMVWPALRKHATWLAPYAYGTTPPTPGGNCIFWNGDDAVSLQKLVSGTWTDIDIFGEIGIRPSNWQGPGNYSPSGAWTDTKPYITGTGQYLTKSKTLKRKHNIKHGVDLATMFSYGNTSTGGVPDSFYALLEYDSMPVNFFDSLGQHWCDCKTSSGIGNLTHNQSVVITPNPVTNNRFTVQTSAPVSSVEVVSIVGQTVYSHVFVSHQWDVKVSLNNIPEGIYLVKVLFSDNQSVIKKIIVQ
ncbi:MAG: T9SS type A sorting domain-containing protein [Bacteroidetes bacterium]|nr:T9SS type A sorting domain-containing protein [Bacteroidota bacterium]